MKRIIVIVSGALLMISTSIFAQGISKGECIKTLDEMIKNSSTKSEMLTDFRNAVNNASFNYASFEDLAKKSVQYNMDSKTAYSIMDAIKKSNFENSLFLSMIELAVLMQSVDNNYLSLLEKVSLSSKEVEITDLKRKISEMRSAAKYKSLEEVPLKK